MMPVTETPAFSTSFEGKAHEWASVRAWFDEQRRHDPVRSCIDILDAMVLNSTTTWAGVEYHVLHHEEFRAQTIALKDLLVASLDPHLSFRDYIRCESRDKKERSKVLKDALRRLKEVGVEPEGGGSEQDQMHVEVRFEMTVAQARAFGYSPNDLLRAVEHELDAVVLLEHTPEPWVFGPSLGVLLGEEDAKFHISTGKGPMWIAARVGSEADARRIVACVNACAGINPEAVPALRAACAAVLTAIDAFPHSRQKTPFGKPDGGIARMLRNVLDKARPRGEPPGKP